MKQKLDLVYSPCTTSGQETERVHSYNPGAHMGAIWPEDGDQLVVFAICC